jgi:hypothetical protein
MNLPDGAEFAWFLSGMWAVLFILRAGRMSQAGFFAVMAMLVVAIVPALGLLFEAQLAEFAARVQTVISSPS